MLIRGAAVVTGVISLCVLSTSASAQSAGSTGGASGTPLWEIEAHAGASTSASLTSALVSTPPLGASILTSSPTFPARQVPSWFFGDGASQLNGASAALGLPGRVTPLDVAFRALGSGIVSGGVRISRRLTSRFAAEFSLDVIAGSSSLSDLRSASASAADSFKTTFAGVLSSGPFAGVTIDSSSAVAGGAGRALATTGALRWRLAPGASWSPYATFGGGVLLDSGSLPSATLDGRYQFQILGAFPIAEADHVVLRYQSSAAPVAVAGFGLTHGLGGGAWALNVDARVFFGSSGATLRLDAAPSVTTGTPAGSIEFDSSPALQFSNNPATGRQSTLSGSALSGFTLLSGGVNARVLVTVGLVRRF